MKLTISHKSSSRPSSRKNSKQRTSTVSRKIPTKGKDKLKLQFEIWICEINNFPDPYVGKTVYVDWLRGSKRVSGSTKRALVSVKKNVTWEDKILFECRIVRNEEVYQPTDLVLKLKDDRTKSLIARCTIDVSQYISQNVTQPFTASFKEIKSLKLKFRIKSVLLAINDQRILGEVGIDEFDADDPNYLIYENKGFITQTEQNVTDNTLSNTEEDDFFDSALDVVSEAKSGPTTPRVSPRARSPVRSPRKASRGSGSFNVNGSAENSSISRNMEKKNHELEEQLQQKEERLKNYEIESGFLQKQNNTLRTDNQKYKRRITQLEHQAAQFGMDTTARIEEPQIDPTVMDELREKCERLEVVNNELNQTVEQLNEQLQQQLEHFKDSQQRITRQRTERKKNRTAIKAARAEVSRRVESKSSRPKIITNEEREDDEDDDDEEDDVIISKLNFNDPHVVMKLQVRLAMQEQLSGPIIPKSNSKHKELDQVTLDEVAIIQRKIARNIYQADLILEKDDILNGICVPSIATALMVLLHEENVFKEPKTKLLSSVINAIRAVTTKKIPNTAFESSVYWLSTVSITRHYLSQYEGITFVEDFTSQMEELVHVAYSNVLNQFALTITPQLVTVFFPQTDDLPKPRQSTMNILSTQSVQSWTINHVIAYFTDTLLAFRRYSVPLLLIKMLMESMARLVNRLLFNMLVTKPNLCTAANGFQIKLGLSLLDEWISNKNNLPFVGRVAALLAPITEAATVLSLDKDTLVQDGTISQIAPSLNVRQIRLLINNFQPDHLSPHPVSSAILAKLDKLCADTPSQGFAIEIPEEDVKLDLSFIDQPLEKQLSYL